MSHYPVMQYSAMFNVLFKKKIISKLKYDVRIYCLVMAVILSSFESFMYVLSRYENIELIIETCFLADNVYHLYYQVNQVICAM